MQFVKKLLRKHEKPLQQIHRRLAEGHFSEKKHRNAPGGTFPYLKSPLRRIKLADGCTDPHKSLIFKNFELTSKEPNNCCILKNNSVIYVTALGRRDDEIVVIGRKFLKTEPIPDYPIQDSRDMGLFIASQLSNVVKVYEADSILKKACLFIYKDVFYVMSLLHH